MNDFYYRKLKVYHQSMQLVMNVYQLSKTFPAFELHGLTNQLQRAAVSIPSNIAEGMGRFSNKERIHFLDIAYGSLTETMCEMEIALDNQYISQEDFNQIEQLASRVSMTIYGLKKSLEEKKKKQKMKI